MSLTSLMKCWQGSVDAWSLLLPAICHHHRRSGGAGQEPNHLLSPGHLSPLGCLQHDLPFPGPLVSHPAYLHTLHSAASRQALAECSLLARVTIPPSSMLAHKLHEQWLHLQLATADCLLSKLLE